MGPTTRQEAEKYRYNQWGGNPRGTAFDADRCAEEVPRSGGWLFYQCSRKPGHGPDALFCKQHAKRFLSEAKS